MRNYDILKQNEIINIFIDLLKMSEKEEVVAMIAFDYYNKLNGLVVLKRGTNAFNRIDADYIINKAIMLNAYSIIIAYNSPENINKLDERYYSFNKKLLNEAKKFEILIKDHLIIVDENKWTSIK